MRHAFLLESRSRSGGGLLGHCGTARCLAENLTKSNCCHFYAFHLIWRATAAGGAATGRSNTPVGARDVLSFYSVLQMDHFKCHIWLLRPLGLVRAEQMKCEWDCNENFWLLFRVLCLALISPKDETRLNGATYNSCASRIGTGTLRIRYIHACIYTTPPFEVDLADYLHTCNWHFGAQQNKASSACESSTEELSERLRACFA